MKQYRDLMVKNQIKARGITDQRVLDAMSTVEREKFAPGVDPLSVYGDHPSPIGYGQTISQPYIVALMTQLCGLRGNEKVLEIGTGSGYQTAILSLLAKKVYTIELVEPLGKSAAKRLADLGYKNVECRIGDGYAGWPEHAPFDVIIITAAPPEIPPRLVEQLSKEDGVMVVPVGEFSQELLKITRSGDSLKKEFITSVRFVPMIKTDTNRE